MLERKIVQAVCEEYQITPEQLKADSRVHILNEARQMVCYLLKDDLVQSEIAQVIGRKDHTTVSNAIRRMENYMKVYKITKERYGRICSALDDLEIKEGMKLNLTKDKLSALHLLLSSCIEQWPAENVADSLVVEILKGLIERLYTRIRRLQNNSNAGANIKISNIEAMALHVYWTNMEAVINATYSDHTYEFIVMRNVVYQIDKELC